MTVHRLTWTQLGYVHSCDFTDEVAARDAAGFLATNHAVRDVAVNPLPPSEPYDLRGPRPLRREPGGSIQDAQAWQ